MKPIAVTGCLPEMPGAFPDDMPENAGNMIHANAPFEMFSNAVFSGGNGWRASGRESFVEFVNKDCSHLVVTVANYLKVGDPDGAHYESFRRYLDQFDVPLVIFGLGAQSKSLSLEGASLPAEAVTLLQAIGSRTRSIGVRGDFTARLIEQTAGVTNVHVTGCPSFFSRPAALEALNSRRRQRIGEPAIAYSGTVLHEEPETEMLYAAIDQDAFLVEPVNSFNYKYYLSAISRQEDVEPPWFLRRGLSEGRFTEDRLREYYGKRFRLFRTTKDWYRFNEQSVDFTYGTRFHVNMASVLSGKPALWLTHDSRTEELARFLHLPHVDVSDAARFDASSLVAAANYDEMFDHLPGLFQNFNEFLAENELPALRVPFETAK